ncbi:M15 family metallopeptidase [Vibrio mediterranei]|uniref:D-alanyl-D-alanine carboxypeptidase family protein n=1 Tax=Vibrio mediterranei TaxID=689 RepID=A0A3G4V7P1_9VIBR|nr:M15 family metallopeptidase [Vibrio mediterranei]AYV20760.1 D-alanyl-D-alanine carboxypeptidase family protein [Vibrio mediterranei]
MDRKQLVGQSECELVPLQVGNKAFLVHQQVRQDLHALIQAASSEGFQLYIASGFRSFERQLGIWNNKMSGGKPILDDDSHPMDTTALSDEQKVLSILRWSALPGASRHHWGTDFDVYAGNLLPVDTSLALEPWEYTQGLQVPFYQWLKNNASRYGFRFPYQQDRGGVAFEPWHISHHATAEQCLNQLSITLLQETLEQSEILGQRAILSQLDYIYNQYITNIQR